MKRLTLLLALLLATLSLNGQSRLHRRIPPMPYAHTERNALRFPGGDAPDFDFWSS